MGFIERTKEEYQEGGLLKVLREKIRKNFGPLYDLIYPLVDYINRKRSISRLKEIEGEPQDLECLSPNDRSEMEMAVLQAYMYKGCGRYSSITPSQVPSELIELVRFVRENNPETVVEIGTGKGGTFYVWTKAFDTADKFVSIDLPRPSRSMEKRAKFLKEISDKSVHCIRQNSHDESTKENLKEILRDREIDFLFMDGDHRYEGVKQDFEMYKDLVAEGGIIAFHDIVPHPDDPYCFVDKFWNEVKSEYETKEIIADEDQEWAGIGVIKL